MLADHNLLWILQTRFGQPRFLFPSEVFFWIAQRVPTLVNLEDQNAKALISLFGYQMASKIGHYETIYQRHTVGAFALIREQIGIFPFRRLHPSTRQYCHCGLAIGIGHWAIQSAYCTEQVQQQRILPPPPT